MSKDDEIRIDENGNFSNMNLVKFPGTKKIKDFKSLNFSFNPINSFKTLSTLRHLVSIDLTATNISSLEFLPSLPHLQSITLRGTQFSRFKQYRLMCIVAFDPSIKFIDGTEIESKEKIIVNKEFSKIQNLLVEGWIIARVNPTIMAYPPLKLQAPLTAIFCDEYSKVKSKSDVIIANEVLTQLTRSVVSTITNDDSVGGKENDEYKIVRYILKGKTDDMATGLLMSSQVALKVTNQYHFNIESNMNPLEKIDPPPKEPTNNNTKNNENTTNTEKNTEKTGKSGKVRIKKKIMVPVKKEVKEVEIQSPVRISDDNEINIQPAPPLDPHLTEIIADSFKESMKGQNQSSEDEILDISTSKLPPPPDEIEETPKRKKKIIKKVRKVPTNQPESPKIQENNNIEQEAVEEQSKSPRRKRVRRKNTNGQSISTDISTSKTENPQIEEAPISPQRKRVRPVRGLQSMTNTETPTASHQEEKNNSEIKPEISSESQKQKSENIPSNNNSSIQSLESQSTKSKSISKESQTKSKESHSISKESHSQSKETQNNSVNLSNSKESQISSKQKTTGTKTSESKNIQEESTKKSSEKEESYQLSNDYSEEEDDYTYVDSDSYFKSGDEYDLSSNEDDIENFKLPPKKDKLEKPDFTEDRIKFKERAVYEHRVILDCPPTNSKFMKKRFVDTRPKQLVLNPVRFHPLHKNIPNAESIPCDFITNDFSDDGEKSVKERNFVFANGEVFHTMTFFDVHEEEEETGHTYTYIFEELKREKEKLEESKSFKERKIKRDKKHDEEEDFVTDVDYMYCSPLMFAPDRYDSKDSTKDDDSSNLNEEEDSYTSTTTSTTDSHTSYHIFKRNYRK
ncbi:hypothetical protein TVAG_454240 [Trichomonas vaginalis G3]|uniref:Leucine Rich Repeat family protein n=1 Tax=Trichomonas vaginalis (strain ATCC PRA-98 / G3) TaxID=412133 RepID=A2DQ00_TRIV3|nr:protein phosphatase 1 regulatory subunit SDS22-related family [Trichomonas vaginalis G3]EAY17596.1 hypothetical protein TVAG_454240 [Trichomonas vaginalis G3]KAI5520640.1 protein phosphatase 1 regulatory subunit SDS22-related family [Trichomonas vaginalis G3]|eukprot:XP_001329731.1 hypothetical protein [Trichomonas vaginalis G3]